MTIDEGPVILVIGATGNVGYSALKTFLRSEELTRAKYRIRAACYRHSSKLDKIRTMSGLDRCYEIDADELGPELDRSFQDVDYAFLIPSSSRLRVKHIQNYVEAAKRNSVRYLVLLSIIRAEEQQATRLGTEFRAMEEFVESAAPDLKYSFIRTNILDQALFMFTPDIRKGVLPLPIKDGLFAPLDDEDAAEFAISLFLNPDRHASKAYHLTGPEIVSGHDIAAIASRALNRTVRYVNVSPANCKKLMMDSGVEEWLADSFNGMFEEISKNQYVSWEWSVSSRSSRLLF